MEQAGMVIRPHQELDVWPPLPETHFAEKLDADETEALARTLKKLG